MQDIKRETIEVISNNRFGALAKNDCISPFFSNNKNYVAFYTYSTIYSSLQTENKLELVIKDIKHNLYYFPNTKVNGIFGNGECPIPINNRLNKDIYPALFCPDDSKILFLSKSTNLIDDEFVLNDTPSLGYRWYVKNILTGSITRVSGYDDVFGDLDDDFEAFWIDNNRIVFTSYSNNLSTNLTTASQDVFIKDLSNDTIELISRRETGNSNPFFLYGCFDIAFSNTNLVSFYSQEIGYCIKNIDTTELIEIKNLTGMINESVVLANFFKWNKTGDKVLFRLQADILNDTNNQEDDYLYDFTLNEIIAVNENVSGIFGDSTSKDSSFNDIGLVAFLSNSTNLDPSSTNEVFNLYAKDISTGDLYRISNSFLNGDLDGDVLGYSWLSDTEICFTTISTNISVSDDVTVRWYYKNIDTSELIKINEYNDVIQFNVYNQYNSVLRKELFDSSIQKMLFVTKPETLGYALNSAGYNIYNVFLKTFKDSIQEFPVIEPIYSTANDNINCTLTSNESSNQYTFLDDITNTPTLSIVSSTYTEKINSIQYRNTNSDVRWLHLIYPEIPDDGNTVRMGAGIFKSSPTLTDDLLSVKKDITPVVMNPVIGKLVSFEVKPSNNIVIVSAGDDQYQICSSIVTLTATIRGYETGHTFLFEQISGTNVTLYQISNTEAYYIAGNTTDLVFRYWIDKGYPNQQYDDITIYTTPTSFIRNEINYDLVNTNPFIFYSSLYIRSASFTNEFDETIPFNSSGTFVSSGDSALEWEYPIMFYETETPFIAQFKEFYTSSKLQTHNGTKWVDTTSKELLEKRYYSPVTDVVRVGASYKEPFKEEYTLYNNPIYIFPYISGKTVISKADYDVAIIDSVIDTLVYVLNILTYDEDVNRHYYDLADIQNTISRSIYSLSLLDYEENITKADLSYYDLSMIKFTITRVNGGNIGG